MRTRATRRAGWILPVLARRAVAQRGVLAVVTALVVATTTMVGAATVLLTVAQDRAPGIALAQAAPADVSVSVDVRLTDLGSDDGAYDARAAFDAAHAALAHLVAPAQVRTTVWPESNLLTAAPDGVPPRNGPATYLAGVPEAGAVEVLDGSLPPSGAGAQDDAVVRVAVPERAAHDLGWAVGDRFGVRGLADDTAVVVEVTGVYRPRDVQRAWTFDQTAGAQYEPALPVPGTAGQVTIPAWGPLLAPTDELLDGSVAPVRMRVTVDPDLSGLTAAQARGMTGRLADAKTDVAAALAGKASWPQVSTALGGVLDGLFGRLAVTQAAILVAVLVLVLVGGAAALLAARLVAEQRASDVALMFSRGTSHRQQVALAGVEALGVAVVAGVLAPPLAAGLLRLGGALGLGGGVVPSVSEALGSPALWLASAACGLLLSGLLQVPVLRRGADRSPGPRTRASAGSLSAVVRGSAGVVALAGIAAVATWQLSVRQVVPGRLDPVVVTAPALLLLACGLLVVRALPLLARVTDRAAAQSRRLVAPLAAWESGRRPERAAQAVLLVTLAVGAATFALVTLSTWRTSQVDQAALAVGAPVRLSGTASDPLAAADQVRAFEQDRDLDLVPVLSMPAGYSTAHRPSTGARLVAVDDASLLRGRLEPVAGLPSELGAADWSAVLAEAGPAGTGPHGTALAAGPELPAGTTELSADVTVASVRDSGYGATLYAILEDADGVRTSRRLVRPVFLTARIPADDAPHRVTATLRDDRAASGPARLVGLLVSAALDDDTGSQRLVSVRVGLSGLTAVDATGAATAVALDGPWAARTTLFGGGASLDPAAQHQDPADARVTDRALLLTRDLSMGTFSESGGGFVAAPADPGGTTFPGTDDGTITPVPAVITQRLAQELELEPGDTMTLHHGVSVPLVVTAVVRHLPGGTTDGVLLRHDLLQRAQLALAVPWTPPGEWWGTAGPRFVAHGGPVPGDLRTEAAERDRLSDGPDRAGLQAALWLLTAAAVALAAAGAATSVAGGLYMRRLDIARLQALGVPRRALVRSVLAEHGLLLGVGLVGGALVGGAVAVLLAVRLAVGPDGGPPVPEASLDVPWPGLAVLAVVVAGLVALAVGATARSLVRRARAELLRLGADR
ncbi:FtsX-like permease family protein [Xylanimonas sp. McL0601]|uniref:FtsX-like permease family protein n=1 Tax=Xylanimonas sp. McL0601 TaxID=3414739 RepID=UPI003CF1B8CA